MHSGKKVACLLTLMAATMVFLALSVTAVYAKTPVVTHSITVTQADGGKITPAKATVKDGKKQVFTIAPKTGYKVASITTDEGDVTDMAVTNGKAYKYTFSNVTADHTITAEFQKETYTLTVNISGTGGAGGTVEDDSGVLEPGDTSYTGTYEYGTLVTLTATPDSSSVLKGWTGCRATNDTCKVTMTKNTTIGVIFKTPTTSASTESTTFWTATLPGTIFSGEDGTGEGTFFLVQMKQSGSSLSGTWNYEDTQGRSGTFNFTGSISNGTITTESMDPDPACGSRMITSTGKYTSGSKTMALSDSAPAGGSCDALKGPSLTYKLAKPAKYTTSGTYSYDSANSILNMHHANSNFPVDNGPQAGDDKHETVISITETEMEWQGVDDVVWKRTSGTADDPVGIWTAFVSDCLYQLTINSDGTFSVAGNIVQSGIGEGTGTSDGGTGLGTSDYTVNISITGSTAHVGSVQVCVYFGDINNSTCGQSGGFAVGQTGTILVSAIPGSSYTVKVPSNQPAATYCSVTSGGTGVFSASMTTGVVTCN